MYFDEHNPPHFHVEYNEHKASINIKTFGVSEKNRYKMDNLPLYPILVGKLCMIPAKLKEVNTIVNNHTL